MAQHTTDFATIRATKLETFDSTLIAAVESTNHATKQPTHK